MCNNTATRRSRHETRPTMPGENSPPGSNDSGSRGPSHQQVNQTDHRDTDADQNR
ncbi:hypothetical protein RISK_003245 [Rhodopirellula islandica]|uniref:Uncharacterized protein n=1 Tax=Rhodopirellula islandica TaxID=595434 RepID=A0A0J1BDD4_RHOIS|nr:hypothetical protein RISK_003245 [Rhodopirellula islandica]